MRAIGAAVGIGIVVALALPLQPAAAAGAAPITVIGGTAFDLSADPTAAETISVPIVIAAKTKNLVVQRVDVTHGQVRTQALLQAVDVKLDTHPVPHTLVITAHPGTLAETGTYTVDVLATSKGNNPQTITITLNRPSAAVDPIPTVTQSRTRSYIWTDDSVRAGALVLAETSGKTSLTGVTVEQTGPPVAGGGTVQIDSSRLIKAGTQVSLPVTTKGHFPLGTTPVTMRLRSPQLAAPISFTVQITQKISRGWLIGIAALGAIVSWLLRDLTLALISKGRAKKRAGQLKTEIEALLDTYKDPDLVAAVMKEHAKLVTAIDQHASTLATVVPDVEAAVTAAQKAYERARTDAASEIDTLRSTLAPAAQPTAIRAALKSLRTKVDQAEHVLDDGRPSAALKDLAKAKTAAATDLAAAMTAWRATVRASLAALADDLDGPARMRLAAGLLLGQLDDPPLVEPEGVDPAALLTALDHFRDRLQDALEPARLWRANAERAVTILREHSAVASERIDALAAAADALPTVALPSVEATLEKLVAAVPTLGQAAEAALLDPLSAVAPAARRHNVETRVTARLATGQFDAAATEVAEAMPHADVTQLGGSGDLRVTLGLQADPVDFVGADVRTLTRTRVPNGSSGVTPAVGKAMAVWDSSTVVQIRGWVELSAGRLLQALVTAILAVLLVVSLFGADWVGTPSDLAKVFFWGLTVNLSADALTKTASSLVPAPAGK